MPKLLHDYSLADLSLDKENKSYVSEPFQIEDLGEEVPDPNWFSIHLDADIPSGSRIDVNLQASDLVNLWDDKSGSELPAVFEGSKHPIFAAARTKRRKYLKLKVELQGDGNISQMLRNVKISYMGPCPSLISYLPAVYQQGGAGRDFLGRFLGVFEREIYGMEAMISGLPDYFDPKKAPKDFYPWLADWLALDLYELLGEKNRDFIMNANNLYTKKGTAAGLWDLVRTLTGRECHVKEYANYVFRSFGLEHWELEGRKLEDLSYHEMSRTFDGKKYLAAESSPDTYTEDLHLTLDFRELDVRKGHLPNSVGIFISQESIFKLYTPKLMELINSFLPIFVEPKPILVPEYNIVELINLKKIEDFQEYKIFRGWVGLKSYGEKVKDFDVTNNIKFRTFRPEIYTSQSQG